LLLSTMLRRRCCWGSTENARKANGEQRKFQGMKMQMSASVTSITGFSDTFSAATVDRYLLPARLSGNPPHAAAAVE